MRPAWDVEEQGTLFFLEMYVKEGRNELREARGKVSLIPEPSDPWGAYGPSNRNGTDNVHIPLRPRLHVLVMGMNRVTGNRPTSERIFLVAALHACQACRHVRMRRPTQSGTSLFMPTHSSTGGPGYDTGWLPVHVRRRWRRCRPGPQWFSIPSGYGHRLWRTDRAWSSPF